MAFNRCIASGTFSGGVWEIHQLDDYCVLWVNGVSELWADTVEEAHQYVEEYLE